MNLRTKTFLIIFGVFIAAFAIMAVLLSKFIMSGYELEEENSVRDKINQVQSIIADDLDNIETEAADWGEWDDTYKFIAEKNSEYLKSNLVGSAFTNHQFNLMAFIDISGNIVFAKAYDLANKEEVPISDALMAYLKPGSPLLVGSDNDTGMTGKITVGDHLMLVSSHPILTSLGAGPTRGTIIFGRYLDALELGRISNISRLSISGHQLSEAGIPSDFLEVLPALIKGKPYEPKVINDNSIAGYTKLDDINGQMTYILKIESSRPQYAESRNDALYFILALIAFGLLFIMVVLLILERLVISRVSNLSGKVSYIGQKGDLSSRVNLSGNDEISSLATDINKMLENMEQARRLQKESETFNYTLLQDSPNPIEVTNADGSIRYVNPALERITGYSQTQLIGRRPPFPWWANENTQQYLSDLREVAAKGVSKIEKNFRSPQGDPFWVEITSSVIRQDNEIKYYISNWVDISERKQAEQALRESENRFRELAELLPELVFEIDLQAKLIFVNRVAFSVFGYPAEDYCKLSLTDLIAPEYRTSVMQYIKKNIAGEHIGNTEYVALRKDESRFPAFIHTTPIKNSQGEVTGLRGILVDITTQKEIEAELRASEEFSSSLLNNAPNPIIVSNVDSSIRYINPAMEKLTGFSSIDVIGKTAPHPWWPNGQSERFDDQNMSLKGVERCYRKKNGDLFWVTITNNPFVENGEVQYYVGNWVDITERKRTEDALRASEDFSSSLSDNSPYPLMVISPDTTIRYANTALEKLTGYSSGELIGQKPPYPFWSREQTVEFLSGINRDILASRKSESLYLKKSGESFYVDITTTPILEGENIKYSLSIWVDITAQKLANEQMEQLYQREKNLREALQSEIRSRAEFTRALVHELKTPLTPIMASSELLVEELTEEPFLGLARNVHRGAENMNRRVDELLDLARGDVGMLKVNLNPVDPEKLLNEVMKYMEPSAKSSGQSLTMELPEKLPIITADDDRVRQILFNLITNSIKYSLPGGHIKITAREEGENLVMEIQDTGRGMSDEEQEKLFQPYYRIEGRERLSGLGLGLALSKRLVELQNGRIWVHSQKGVGSTFSFSLPIKTDSQIGNMAKTGGKS